MKTIFCAFATALILHSCLPAQDYRPQGNFTFNADFARFRYDSTSMFVEVYYGLYPRLMRYYRVDSLYKGMAIIHTQIRQKDRDSNLVNQRFLIPLTITDTLFRNVNATFVTQSSYAVPFGEYVLNVSTYDSLQPSRRDSVSYVLSLRGYPRVAAASDLELCSEVGETKHQSKLFEKNSLDVVPNPSLVFGVTTHPVSFYYLELYNLIPDSTYTIKEELLDGANKVMRESTKHQKYGTRNVVDVGMMNLSSFPSGRYHMTVSVFNQGGDRLTNADKVLFLSNPHVKPPAVSTTTLISTVFSGMSFDELSKEFRECEYLATPEETKQFKSLTTQEALRNFVSKFWTRVQSGEGGRNPITRDVYLQRVATANQRYRSMGKEGWQTDRGRVYLLFGEPDEIERFPSSGDSKPYEIWHYYQIESGVEFDFIDRTGFGVYVLVNSTKRGEIQDDSWRNYLP